MAAGHMQILSPDDLREAIKVIFSRKGDKVVEDNIKAFNLGYESIQ
jgi:Pyruvate/2-oxoacid:ferredoxin oxidoreductase gamma subunit